MRAHSEETLSRVGGAVTVSALAVWSVADFFDRGTPNVGIAVAWAGVIVGAVLGSEYIVTRSVRVALVWAMAWGAVGAVVGLVVAYSVVDDHTLLGYPIVAGLAGVLTGAAYSALRIPTQTQWRSPAANGALHGGAAALVGTVGFFFAWALVPALRSFCGLATVGLIVGVALVLGPLLGIAIASARQRRREETPPDGRR
jgi:hypothetical protein